MPSGAFDGLDSLARLYLSGNELPSGLPGGAFDGLTSLIELDLSGTGLWRSGLSKDTFRDLGNLEILNIANTGFTARTHEGQY